MVSFLRNSKKAKTFVHIYKHYFTFTTKFEAALNWIPNNNIEIVILIGNKTKTNLLGSGVHGEGDCSLEGPHGPVPAHRTGWNWVFFVTVLVPRTPWIIWCLSCMIKVDDISNQAGQAEEGGDGRGGKRRHRWHHLPRCLCLNWHLYNHWHRYHHPHNHWHQHHQNHQNHHHDHVQSTRRGERLKTEEKHENQLIGARCAQVKF